MASRDTPGSTGTHTGTQGPAVPMWIGTLDADSGDASIASLCIDTIRTLSIDAIQRANSGHPGTPMAMAPVVYALWQHCLRFDPATPDWPNRDRFVLSAGHASMLLYSVLHLAGVRSAESDYEISGKAAVSLEDIKSFRQLGSRCAGHPEYHWTTGVECTTGPLAQGLAMSVGMAMASQWLKCRYNRPGFELFDHDVYSLCGDGCMMEGLSSEAASLAGHLELGNLCWIYDSNRITIEGPTSLAFSDDVASRFLSYGWNVERVGDANDVERLLRAFATFKKTQDRPTLIIVDSHIGYGAPNKMGTAAAHGEPLGEDEVRLAKRSYGWPEEESFLVPDGVRQHFENGIGKRGRVLHAAWEVMFLEYQQRYPELAEELERMQRRELPNNWQDNLPSFPPSAKGIASREASGKVLNALAQKVPWLVGGSADLAPSAKTRLSFENAGDFQAGHYGGRNIHFGVREHAMAAILNGLSLSKLRPYGSGFLIFSDYARSSIRLSALMQVPVIHIFTHDSIAVGEDGPTHQPIEHLISLRAIPNLAVIRPADANEVVEAWKLVIQMRRFPAALILSRQPLPTLDRSKYASAAGLFQGAYVLADAEHARPDVILLATGSEVHLCIEAYEALTAEGIRVRVVSMPSWELFERQSQEYRDKVLPPTVRARVAVEQASTLGWAHYVGLDGVILGMKTFGASAPLMVLQREFGFTKEGIVAAAREQLARAALPEIAPDPPRSL